MSVRPTLLLAGLLAAQVASAQAPPAYRDSARTVAERTRDLLNRMTLEEKFWQLFMLPDRLSDSTHDYSHGLFGLQLKADAPAGSPAGAARFDADLINAFQRRLVTGTRLGIPMIPFDEAVHGLVRDGATMFPQAIALAATWDTALVGRVAEAIARETRSRGIRQVLSPVVNLARDVRWGRVEETYGEDPYLSSSMAVAYVGAMERHGVIATPKHFVANVGEGGRDSYPIEVSRRELAQSYFPPFEAAIHQGGAQSVMSAYNSVNGVPATQNRWLLTEVLRRQWRFPGFVISDASATGGATVLHDTEPDTPTAAAHAFAAGLDVVFQSGWAEHRPYLEAVRRGLIPRATIDSAVSRVLRAKFRLGLFEHPYVDPDSAAYWSSRPAHRALAREAAGRSMVLLRNRDGRLPLTTEAGRIAVIGADADDPRLGGYSGPGVDPISILDGLRHRAPAGVRVEFSRGPGRVGRDVSVVPGSALSAGPAGQDRGLAAEYFAGIRLGGRPAATRQDSIVDFHWTLGSPAPGLARDWYSVRWQGRVTMPPGRPRRIGVEGNDGYRLWVDDRLAIDDWTKRSFGTQLTAEPLEPGRSYRIRLEYFETRGNARVRLVWDDPSPWRAEIDSAVALAGASDLAIVVAGIEEGEFRDRSSLALPGHQEALIRRVAATGTPVVVVLIGGSAVTMTRWIDSVDAVLMAWYPGEAGGAAVADVLFGDVDPGGRLPITFPLAEGQLPLYYDHEPTGRGDDYLDLSGMPLFPFGYGLSYTSFELSDLRVAWTGTRAAPAAVVRLRVRNTGSRPGNEVVQLYLRDELASVVRPVIQLAGFRSVHLAPDETRDVAFSLGADQLGLVTEDLRRIVEPGRFRVMVGASSRDIRLRGELVVP
jgi:beta-glucosidase